MRFSIASETHFNPPGISRIIGRKVKKIKEMSLLWDCDASESPGSYTLKGLSVVTRLKAHIIRARKIRRDTNPEARTFRGDSVTWLSSSASVSSRSVRLKRVK